MSKLPKAFQKFIVSIPAGHLVSQTVITPEIRAGVAFRQSEASVMEIGIIEPLAVFERPTKDFLVLDGNIRLEVLRASGALRGEVHPCNR